LFLLGVAFVDCSDGGRNGRFRHHRRFHHWADLVETAVSKLLSCGVGLVDFSGGGWKRPFPLQGFHLREGDVSFVGLQQDVFGRFRGVELGNMQWKQLCLIC
jgi:hypothetical protein